MYSDNMFCANKYCYCNNFGFCKNREVEIDITGHCKTYIYIDISDKQLLELKEKQEPEITKQMIEKALALMEKENEHF